ncbi:MAG: hypothetical protein STSR0002_10280 [Smithella sp.]
MIVVVRVQETIDIFVIRFQMPGEGKGIADIIMTGINYGFIRQRHQPFDREIKIFLIAGKTIANGSVEDGVAGDQTIACMKADRVVRMSGSPVNQDCFPINNNFMIVG